MGAVRKKIRRWLPIKASFMIYMLIFILIAALFFALECYLAYMLEDRIVDKYIADYSGFMGYSTKYIYFEDGMFVPISESDGSMLSLLENVPTICLPVNFIICTVLAGLLFYRNCLKTPLRILKNASERIAASDLDFKVEYSRKNEMGTLCDSFETMRLALVDNNTQMWRAMEERRRMSAVFAHDLRTPLTVLHGYCEILTKYARNDEYSYEQVVNTAKTMSRSVERLERYVAVVSELRKIEDSTCFPVECDGGELCEELRSGAQILCGEKLELVFSGKMHNRVFIDKALAMRVFENMASNAVRFATSKIWVKIKQESDIITLRIENDGQLFTKEQLSRALMPYYSTGEGEEHFGLGLSICKALCENHGGSVKVFNSNGRAVTSAQLRSTQHISILAPENI